MITIQQVGRIGLSISTRMLLWMVALLPLFVLVGAAIGATVADPGVARHEVASEMPAEAPTDAEPVDNPAIPDQFERSGEPSAVGKTMVELIWSVARPLTIWGAGLGATLLAPLPDLVASLLLQVAMLGWISGVVGVFIWPQAKRVIRS